MANISHHQFIALLKKSNVVEAKKLQPWLDQSTKIESARKLAKSLVQQELLTTWQAKFLLSGRYRLRIGNYFLLSRLQRDDLGARYLAIHANLNRKVELQIFARDLTSDTKRWKNMIQKASLVAKLDHPALVHVYDIDHDDERYFLVVEHVPGRPLDVQTEIFTPPQIGRLILQCAEGIEFAHQNDVVHGTISQVDIVLTEEGAVKLQNLTVSPMRNQKDDEPEAKPITDFKALAKLGKELLEANPVSDSSLGADLVEVFALMDAGGAGAMDKLRQWVEATSDVDVKNLQITEAGANPIFSTNLGSSSGVDLSSASGVTYEPDAPDEGEAATSSASIVAAAKASPPFLIACALGLVLFGGIVTYGISRAYSKMVTTTATEAAEDAERDKAQKAKAAKYKERERQQFEAWKAEQDKNEAEGAKQPGKMPDRQRKSRKNREKGGKGSTGNGKVPTKDQNDKSSSAETDEEGADKPKPDESVADSATPEAKEEANKYLDIFGDKEKKKTESTKDGKGNSAKGGAVPAIPAGVDPDNLTKLTNIGPAIQKVLYAEGVKTYQQILEMTPATLDQVLDRGGASKIGEKKWQRAIDDAKPLAEVAAELAKDHFRKVKNQFNLPPINSTKPKVLTKLTIPRNYFLSTELVAPKGIAPHRVFFEMNTDSSEDEKWIVSSKKSRTSQDSVEIATFQKTGNKFIFAWKPEAADNKTAAYLRNCLVRLSTPDGRSHVSSLRTPNKSIRPLRISKESLIDEMSIVIDALPHLDKIEIRLGSLRNKAPSIEVIKPLITFDAPAIVKLKRREKDGFMNLQISAKRVGKTIKLTAALVLRGVPIKSHSQLVAIQQQIEGINATAQRVAKKAKKNSPEQKLAKVAKADFELMEVYQKSIDSLLEGGGGIGEAINFEIVADFEDGRVVLVKSNKNVTKTDKKKK